MIIWRNARENVVERSKRNWKWSVTCLLIVKQFLSHLTWLFHGISFLILRLIFRRLSTVIILCNIGACELKSNKLNQIRKILVMEVLRFYSERKPEAKHFLLSLNASYNTSVNNFLLFFYFVSALNRSCDGQYIFDWIVPFSASISLSLWNVVLSIFV